MDYQRFIAQLPTQYEAAQLPNSPFSQVLAHVNGMTTASILQLLNLAVDCLEPDEVYCEIGCFQGASLVGALLNHPGQMAYAVDNFSEFDPWGTNLERLTETLVQFGLDDQVLFCYQSFEEFFHELAGHHLAMAEPAQMVEPAHPIGLYFYDAAHDYRSQFLGLLLAKPFLAERALIVLTHTHSAAVRQAVQDFMTTQAEAKLVLDLPAQEFAHPEVWNGIQILSWDRSRLGNSIQMAPIQIDSVQMDLVQMDLVRKPLTQEPQAAFLQSMNLLATQERLGIVYRLQTAAAMAIAQYEPVHLQEYGDFPAIVAWVRKPLLEAEALYRQALLWAPLDADLWYNLGTLYSEQKQYETALETLAHSLRLNPAQPAAHCEMGLIFAAVQNMPQAMQAYQAALQADPTWEQAYDGLGKLWLQTGNLTQAETIFRQAIAAQSQSAQSQSAAQAAQSQAAQSQSAQSQSVQGYLGLGEVQLQQGHIDAAIATYQAALALKQTDPDALSGLGMALEAQGNVFQAVLYLADAALFRGNFQEAVRQYQRYFDLQSDPAAIAMEVYLNLANAYRALGQERQAAMVCQQGIQHYPNNEVLHIYQITAWQNAGLTQSAIQAAQAAAAQFPDNPAWQFEQWRTFPILYNNVVEIAVYRDRFRHGLEELIHSTSLETFEECERAMLGIWWRTNFYLQYQCGNDRELQSRYGEYVQQVMAANYPQWAQPLTMPSWAGKIRVGYVSAHLRNHNGAKWALGWIKFRNREQFEIYGYHTGQAADQITRQFQLSCDRFHHLPQDLEAVCQQIRADDLHILVFTDIGMDPMTTQIAGLRLAPVQCTAWGHPVTSGLPTLDYYLSGDRMEPENAQDHYSEALIRLPNTGLCYPQPDIPPLPHTRQDFGLRAEAIVYLCSQSLFKYLPQYDHLFPAIAQRVPQAQFAFLALKDADIVEQFRQRLRQAFATVGLNSEDYCVIVPRQNQLGFWGLNQVADVFLDSLGWNGGNTVFEAIACGLPIVTCPGEFMRGRHACAILETMGMVETIAPTEVDYVAIATRLGLDFPYRTQICQQQQERMAAIYNDVSCVTALEDFYRQVVQNSSVP